MKSGVLRVGEVFEMALVYVKWCLEWRGYGAGLVEDFTQIGSVPYLREWLGEVAL